MAASNWNIVVINGTGLLGWTQEQNYKQDSHRKYLSSKLRSISNLNIVIFRGESSTLSPLLAFSYIFSPLTYNILKLTT